VTPKVVTKSLILSSTTLQNEIALFLSDLYGGNFAKLRIISASELIKPVYTCNNSV